MVNREFLKRAIDESNAFISYDSEAIAVNPNIWDFKLREFEEANLVVTPLAEKHDFRSPGADLKITIDDTPSAAGLLVETTDVTISAFTTRNLTFTPVEQGAAYQTTRKEVVRSFFNVMDRMVRKLGYSMALRKDTLGYTEILAGAGNAVIVNGVSVATDIASTDTLNYAAITSAIQANAADYYVNSEYLLINYFQQKQLLDLGTINKANEFGTRDAIQKGVVGELFGLKVVVSHSVTSASSRAFAVVLARSGSGEAALGYAVKRDPIIETEYHALGRFWDIVGHEEYDFATQHANGMCTILTYSA